MKPFEQLNDAELVSLSGEQVLDYIKLKKAETGIKIIARPDEPKYQILPDPDLTLYEVCGFCFKDQAVAASVCAAINGALKDAYKLDYNWRGSNRVEYAKTFTGSLEQVEMKLVYSMPVYDSIRDVLTSNTRIEEAYKKVKDAFDEEEEKSESIIAGIHDAITNARERIAMFREYKSHIIEYLKLANGNREVAWNFFDKAYPVEPGVKAMIMESPEYIQAIESYTKA